MVGVVDVFSKGGMAQAMVRNATAAKRPNFELQFNLLQNAAIKRLNEKIVAMTADDGLVNGKVDVFLNNTAKKLSTFKNDVNVFIFDNSRNISAAGELSSILDKMDTALSTNDTATFNTELAKLNETVGKTHESNGAPIGIVIPDGTHAIRRDGLVTYNNAGTQTKATSFSDFASTADAQTAVNNAKSKLATITEVLLLKGEAAVDLRTKTEKNLTSAMLQIETAKIADNASKADEIAKLKMELGNFLKSLSLSFESSLSMSDQLAAKLFESPKLQPGSIVNLFG